MTGSKCFLRFISYFMHMTVCPHVHHMHVWCLRKPEEGFRAPGIDVREGYKTLCWCQELKPRSSTGAASAPNHCASSQPRHVKYSPALGRPERQGRWGVESHPRLCREFEISLGPCRKLSSKQVCVNLI